MSKIVENYILQEVVGSGQYGKVYRARNIKTEEVVAVKVIKLAKFVEIPKLEEFTLNEIKTLSKLDNPNVVRFVEMLKTSNNMYLVYEFCNGGTLEQVLQEKKFLTEKDALPIFRQILNAFKTLAKENILHRDLKPSNILIHEGVIKVADFGFCKAMKGPLDLTQTMVGSPIYMAPEILKGHSYSTKADMWSLGVVFYELLFGVCPFEEKSIQRLLVLIETRGLVFSKTNQISQKVEDMLRSMLVADPSKRIDWQSLLANYGDLGLDTTSKPQQQPFHQTTPNFTIGQTGTAPPTNSGTSVNFNPSSVVPPPTSATSYALSRKNSNPTVFRDNSSIVNTMSDQTKPKYVSPEKIDRNSRSQPLRTLLRERNKLLFMIYTANNALDLNLTPTSQLLAFLLLKGISSSVSNIRKLLASGTKDGSEVGRKSLEWNNFAELFEREADDILETFYGFREEFSSVVSRGPSTMWGDDAQITAVLTDSCPVDQGLLKKTILRYLEEIRGAKSRGGSDIERKVLLHSHEVADILILDEFFENFIDVNTKYHEQKYFETLRSCPIEGLNNLLSQKLEFARSRITSVSTSNRPISIHA